MIAPRVRVRWLMVLAVIVLALSVAGCKPAAGPGAAASPLGTPEATSDHTGPLPTVVLTDWTPGTPIAMQPGKEIRVPTMTPWPTSTPRPTPTRRPGPTATAVSILSPAKDASGEIWFTTRTGTFPQIKTSTYILHISTDGRSTDSAMLVDWPKSVTFNPGAVHPSPDGRYVILMQASEPGGVPYVLNRLNGEVKALSHSLGGGSFWGWHPDNRHFLFWIDGAGLWLVDAETLETTTLVYPEGPVQGSAISPDGMRIAYIDSHRPESLGSLWFVSSAGSDAYPIVDVGMGYIYPRAWSPDGGRIVYFGDCGQVAYKEPVSALLCLLDVQTLQRSELNVPYAGFEPVWSPDGSQMAFTGLVPREMACNARKGLSADEYELCWYKTSGVFVVDILTNESRLLTRGVTPVWSPDGSTLVFLSDQGGATELWTIRADGSNLQQLTTDGQFKSPYYQLTWLREVRK